MINYLSSLCVMLGVSHMLLKGMQSMQFFMHAVIVAYRVANENSRLYISPKVVAINDLIFDLTRWM